MGPLPVERRGSGILVRESNRYYVMEAVKASIQEQRMGTDRMFPLVMRMSLPAIAAQVVNLMYSLVDRVYIGHIPDVGTDALAGIGVTASVIILISAFSSIVGGGGAPLASIALGSGHRNSASRFLGNGILMLLFMTALTTFLTYAFMDPILRFSGASENTIGYAREYLSIYLAGTVFVEITVGMNPFINAQGRPGIAMCSVLIGAVLNIILDPLFIFVLDMGVSGAALATVISQACSAVWIISFLLSSRASLRLRWRFMKPHLSVMLRILALGVSPFIMASTESLVGFVLNGSLRDFGDIHVSALAVMQSAMMLVSVPLAGFAQGFVPVAGYNYGQKNVERLKECFRVVVLVMFTFNVTVVLFMMLFPSLIASAFTDDPVLVETVRVYMPVFLAGMTIFGLQRACQNMFVALGQAAVSVFIALLRKVILLVPLAVFLPEVMGVAGVYAAEAIADATAAVCCTAIFAYVFPKILSRLGKNGS